MTDWQDDARCRTVGVTIFFPDDGTTGSALISAYRDAQAVCAHCTVRTQCLETALALEGSAATSSRAGIWGGATPTERATIARKRATTTSSGDVHTAAILDLTRAGNSLTAIGRRLGIDPRTVRAVLDRTAANHREEAAA